jgi:hypothetical protein
MFGFVLSKSQHQERRTLLYISFYQRVIVLGSRLQQYRF